MTAEKIFVRWENKGRSRAFTWSREIYWFPLLVASCTFASTIWLWQVTSSKERTDVNANIQNTVRVAGETVKTEVERQLETRILWLKQMAKRWEDKGQPSRREWRAVAQGYMDFYPNCQNMQWVDSSFKPRWNFSRSEGIPAPDQKTHAKILATFKEKQQQPIVISSPENNQQVWVYVPLFYAGQNYGFLFANYRIQGLVENILKPDFFPEYGLNISTDNAKIFSRNNPDGENAEVWKQEISWPLYGVNWQIDLWPSAAVLAARETGDPEGVLAIGSVISACLTLAAYNAQKAQRRTLEAEKNSLALYQKISDLEQAGAALRQQMEIMDLASDAIIILDLDDTIVYWNQGAENLYGWKKEQVIGKYVHRCLKTIFPQPLEEIKAICLRKGYWQGEVIHTKQNGEQIFVASGWTLQRNNDGHPAGILEINKDISERKQILESLRRSEERFRCAVFYAPFPLIVHAEDGEIITVNQTWTDLSGYTQEDIPTIADWTEKAYGERKNVIKENIDRLYSLNTKVEEGESRINTSNGSQRIWEFSSVPIGQLPDGRRLVMSMAADITDRKQVQEALQRSGSQLRQKATELEHTLQELQSTQAQLIQSEKMSSLGQLVAGVAHEINNPVNFIFGNIDHAKEYSQDLLKLLQIYQKHYPDPPELIQEEIEAIDLEFLMKDLPKLLVSMKVGAERIREIVQSLRNFSRLDESERKAVNIHEGIDSTLMILQNRLKGKPDHPPIQVIKNYGNLPLVECYAGQLNQVFMNLLSNAIDALEDYNKTRSPEEIQANPTQITITTEAIGHKPGKIVIRIADNGKGMTEQVRQRLFDPFFTTKPIGKGTGLGLSIGYQIVVEKHGGKLECCSQPGKGAEFVIEIPN